jgi:hypothetical protein
MNECCITRVFVFVILCKGGYASGKMNNITHQKCTENSKRKLVPTLKFGIVLFTLAIGKYRLVMSTIPKRKHKRSDIEANYQNETKTF